MIGRFGEVLYWLSVGVGALLEITGWSTVIFVPEGKLFGGILIVLGFVIYGVGRACLYILTAR
jgi:hypothetical protein